MRDAIAVFGDSITFVENEMINYLKIKNFTEFSDARFEFSEGLNVVIGDNSTGKNF